MAKNFVLLTIGFLVLPVFLSGICDAQVRRYTPSSPTVSPYLNLGRVSDGGLPNYYSLVRPMQQQRAVNAGERAQSQRQQGQIRKVEGELRQTQNLVAPTGKRAWFMDSGDRTYFQNTTRFYPQVNLRR